MRKKRRKMNYKKSAIRRGRHLTPRTARMKIRQTHWSVCNFWAGPHLWMRLRKHLNIHGFVESAAELERILSGDFSIQPITDEPGKYKYRNGKYVFIVEEMHGMRVMKTFYIEGASSPRVER